MAKNEAIFFTKEGKLSSEVVTPGVPVTIFTAGADGSKLMMVNAASQTGTQTSFELLINTGGGDELLGRNSADVNNQDDILDLTMPNLPVDKNGNKFLNLEPGAVLKMDITGGTSVTASVYAEDY